MNYNAAAYLKRCVESLLTQSLSDFECFIVDNGSTDNSLATLPALDERFSILEMGENLGFAAANNHAAKRASGDWLALLNPDAFAHPDWLEQGLAATQFLPHTAMVGSTQYMAEDLSLYDGLGDEYHAFGIAWRAGFGKPVTQIHDREAFGPCGAGAFYDRKVFDALGGFDTRFFCYHEDVDIAFRMRLAGYRCVQSSKARINHVSSGISGRASDFAVYHGTRNRIWTFFGNMPWPLLILLAVPHICANLAFLVSSLFRKGRFKPTLRGFLHGVFTRPGARAQTIKRQISLITLLRAMGWNPLKVLRRAPVNVTPLNTIEEPANISVARR